MPESETPGVRGRVRSALELYALMVSTYHTTKNLIERWEEWKNRQRDSSKCTLIIDEGVDQYLFEKLMMWTLGQAVRSGPKKDLTVTSWVNELKEFVPQGRTEKFPLKFQGHDVQVIITSNVPEVTNRSGGDSVPAENSSSRLFKTSRSIVFECQNFNVRDLLQKFIEDEFVIPKSTVAPPSLFRSTAHGDWRHVQSLTPRSLDSVILKAGQMESILSDVESFLGRKERCQSLGVPWHRGYLLEGPPGTGKTSLIRALAFHLKRDVHFLNLSDFETNASLLNAVSDVGGDGILVIEDADIAEVTHARETQEDSSAKADLSALLNALDGMFTPEGLITFITSNNPDKFEEALLRKSRIDMTLHLGYLNNEMLARMFTLFLGPGTYDVKVVKQDVPPSDVIDVFSDMDASVVDIVDRVRAIVE